MLAADRNRTFIWVLFPGRTALRTYSKRLPRSHVPITTECRPQQLLRPSTRFPRKLSKLRYISEYNAQPVLITCPCLSGGIEATDLCPLECACIKMSKKWSHSNRGRLASPTINIQLGTFQGIQHEFPQQRWTSSRYKFHSGGGTLKRPKTTFCSEFSLPASYLCNFGPLQCRSCQW